MDKASVIGLGLGLGAILGGNALEGGHLSSLLQPTAAMIVIGGTIGATLIGYPLSTFIHACKAFKDVFLGGKENDTGALIQEITGFALKARRDGILSLEDQLPSVKHPFLRRALVMAVDAPDSNSMPAHPARIPDRPHEPAH